MDLSIKEVTDELIARVVSGPLQFRLIMQPTVAVCLGIRDGMKDAKAGSPPFISGLLFHPAGRIRCLQETLRRLRGPVLIASLIDGIVQYLMFQHIRPLVAVTVGTLLMGLPYSAARGFSNRIRSRRRALLAPRDREAHGPP